MRGNDMESLKKKAIGDIKQMLEGRMVDRMKPKTVAVEVETEKTPVDDGTEIHLDGMKDEFSDGAEKLSPEEQEELSALLEKMGC